MELSLADVEAELRAAEAYLSSAARVGESGVGDSRAERYDPEMRQTSPYRGLTTARGVFTRPERPRPSISEERRRDILAKLSSDRQSAVYAAAQPRERGSETLLLQHEGYGQHGGEQTVAIDGDDEALYRTQFYCHDRDIVEVEGSDIDNSEGDDDDGDGELFYASDIIGKERDEEVQPRSSVDAMISLNNPDEDKEELDQTIPTEYRPKTAFIRDDNPDESVQDTPSLLARVLTRHEAELSSQEFAATTKANSNECDHTLERYHQIPSVEPASRIDKLAQPLTEVHAKREKMRLLKEMEELRRCTFRPSLQTDYRSSQVRHPGHSTGQKRPKSVRFDIHDDESSVLFPWLTLSPRRCKSSIAGSPKRDKTLFDRLHIDVTLKYQQRERQREMLEAEKLRECTFRPRINSLSRRMLNHTDYKPIHERINEIQREKNAYIQRVREEMAQEQNSFSFVPDINPKSREIAESVLSEKQIAKIKTSTIRIDYHDDDTIRELLHPPEVTKRLSEDATHAAEKRIAVQEYYDALEGTSFTPRINEASVKIVEHRPEFKLDFLSRQQYFQMVEEEKLEALEGIFQQEQELTFRPDIGNAERVLQEMRPDLVKETTQQRLHRLIYQEPKRNELRKQRLRDETYAKYTFKPEINRVSKALVEKHSNGSDQARAEKRHELQRYFERKRFRSRVAKELEQAERAECTFRPQLISKNASKPKSNSTSKMMVKQRQGIWRSDNILHLIETERQQRAEELQAKRHELELKELEHCTFQPNIKRSGRPSCKAVKAEAPVVVRGLDRFLETKERAKRQQQELKLREERIFQPHRSYQPRSYTIPKPFKLSEASRDAIRRRLKVKEEMRSRERQECTFSPETIEAQNKKVLRALIHD